MLQRVIDVLHNQFLLTGALSFLLTQVAKVFIHAYVYKEFDWKRIVGDGGMPSGHSASHAYGSVRHYTYNLAVVAYYSLYGIYGNTGSHSDDNSIVFLKII